MAGVGGAALDTDLLSQRRSAPASDCGGENMLLETKQKKGPSVAFEHQELCPGRWAAPSPQWAHEVQTLGGVPTGGGGCNPQESRPSWVLSEASGRSNLIT